MYNSIHPIIVIPIYKGVNEWDKAEYLSLQRCFKVLDRHVIYLTGPKKLNWKEIQEYVSTLFKTRVKVAVFDDQYFASIDGYNKLLKSMFFYYHFKKYTHLLIYQLDAYVFEDQLDYWCKKEYDFIGAPWLENYIDNKSKNFIGVGNGGFSLHNITKAISVLRRVERITYLLNRLEKRDGLIFSILRRFIKYKLFKSYYKVRSLDYFHRLNLDDKINEDYFWGELIPSVFNDFNVAPVEEAIKFSFEVNPAYVYSLNNYRLPFGCHAWSKYDPEFWKRFIH